MNNSLKDFIFGDGNTMNHLFRQFSMGAVAIAVMQVANAQVSITNIVPMQVVGQGTEIRVMFNGLPPQPQAYQLEQPSRLILDFDKAQHTYELVEKDEIIVHLDYRHHGIGSASCGPDVLPKYELHTESFNFNVRLRPFSQNQYAPMSLSRNNKQ